MYTRCLFCAGDLGRNEAVEAFPVGRRLAFDAARGRQWVVCPRCARWNLTPLDERWEAVEQGERVYRDARRRVSTDNVGLARAADGTDLVRVGDARLPEFAAWRYGRQFLSRRVRYSGVAAASTTFGVAAAVGTVALPFVLPAVVPFGGVLGTIAAGLALREVYGRVIPSLASALDVRLKTNADRVVAWLPPEPSGARVPVTFRHLADTRLGQGTDGELTASVAHEFGRSDYAGAGARAVLSTLMPHVNRAGASARDVALAVHAIEVRDGPKAYLRGLARSVARSRVTSRVTSASRLVGASGESVPETGLFALDDTQRLALELALREEVERRAMEGELADLERAWRDAEEIAAIADTLGLPSAVERAFARLRGRTDSAAG